MEWIAVLVTGTVVQLLNWFLGGRQKAAAEKRATFVDDAEQIVGMFREQVEKLTKEVGKLNALIGAFEEELIALGGDPVRIRREFEKRRYQ